jgi:hypothetical protein
MAGHAAGPDTMLAHLSTLAAAAAADSFTAAAPSFSAMPRYGVQRSYTVAMVSRPATPVISHANAKGAGASPCGDTFNPSYIPASAGLATPGLLLRLASCNSSAMPSGEHIGFAPCDLQTGECGDVVESFNFGDGDQDPRAFYCDGSNPGCTTGFYYNFYYGTGQGGGSGPPCTGRLCTVSLKRTRTPLNASSWELIATLPWHRNGCCIQRKTPPHYCIFGEGASKKFQRQFSSAGPWPMAGLGMATTTDFDSGVFNYTNWTGVWHGPGGEYGESGAWLDAMGPGDFEVKLEAGARPVELSTGDYIHFYAAVACNLYVKRGNYTVGAHHHHRVHVAGSTTAPDDAHPTPPAVLLAHA